MAAHAAAVNLFVVMGLGGLWHGANWTFVVWGLLHGLYLAIHRIWVAYSPFRLPRFIAWALTFFAVSMAWVFSAPRTCRKRCSFCITCSLSMRWFYRLASTNLQRVAILQERPLRKHRDRKRLTDWVILGFTLLIAVALPTTKSIAIMSRGRTLWALLCGLLLGLSTILLLEKPSAFIWPNF